MSNNKPTHKQFISTHRKSSKCSRESSTDERRPQRKLNRKRKQEATNAARKAARIASAIADIDRRIARLHGVSVKSSTKTTNHKVRNIK